jgi:hypothetical protein
MISEKKKEEYLSAEVWTGVVGLKALAKSIFPRGRYPSRRRLIN